MISVSTHIKLSDFNGRMIRRWEWEFVWTRPELTGKSVGMEMGFLGEADSIVNSGIFWMRDQLQHMKSYFVILNESLKTFPNEITNRVNRRG